MCCQFIFIRSFHKNAKGNKFEYFEKHSPNDLS